MNGGIYFYIYFFAYLVVESNTSTKSFICRTIQVHTVFIFLKLFIIIF